MFMIGSLVSFILWFFFHLAHVKWVTDAEIIGFILMAAHFVFGGFVWSPGRGRTVA